MQRDPPPMNRLLARLGERDFARLAPHLEVETMELGQVLYEAGETPKCAHFPIDCIVSLLYVLKSGDSSETAMVGNEGIVGTFLYMGGTPPTGRAVVQSSGRAFRLDASVLMQEFQRGESLQRLLLLYTLALLTQITQTAACNKHHSVPQQLCRWLLLGLDRMPGNKLMMTQGLIANMLGVRRDGVTDAAGVLQAAGLIRYDNGTITVLDRAGLESQACECYSVVKREFDGLLENERSG